MILEPHAGTNEPFEADMSGVSLLMNDSLTSAVVDNVVPGTAATDAGLAAGDTLVSIDGKPANAATIRELRKRFPMLVSASCSRCVATERRER